MSLCLNMLEKCAATSGSTQLHGPWLGEQIQNLHNSASHSWWLPTLGSSLILLLWYSSSSEGLCWVLTLGESHLLKEYRRNI